MRYLIIISSLLMILSACTHNNEENVEQQAFEDLRAGIRIAITDAEREKKALLIIDELTEELILLRHKKADREAKTRKLNANYDTTRAEFDAFLTEKHTDISLSQQRILGKRNALIAMTTSEEWEQIIDVRSNSIDVAIKAVQPN